MKRLFKLIGMMAGFSVAAFAQEAAQMPNNCSKAALSDVVDVAAWNGWGGDNANTRYQPLSAARLTTEQIPKLKLKWACGFPGARAVSGQPTVVGGRVFVSSDNGYVYSLDAATGCVYWSYRADAAVRSAVVADRIPALNVGAVF